MGKLNLTWAEVGDVTTNLLPDLISNKLKEAGINPLDVLIFAPPRGGLVLGVCISHALGCPLFTTMSDLHQAMRKPHRTPIFIDDIVDTGTEVERFAAQFPNALTFAWVTKVNAYNGPAKSKTHCLRVAQADEWVVFPWEQSADWEKERDQYAASRQ